MSTEDEAAAAASSTSDPWEPLSSVDYMVLGFVGTFQTLALAICAHLFWYRTWPPYVTKNVNLVIIATVSGVLWTVSMAIASGFWARQSGDILAACDFERFFSWSTLCVHTVAFFIRVYRMWRILIKHDENMWHTEHQILLMSSLSLIPVVVTWAIPRTAVFDEVSNTCNTTTVSSLVTLGMDFLGLLAIAFLWFVCARQLRCVRKQFNEYETMKRTLLYMTVALLSYGVVILYILADDLVTQRRVAMFYPLATTYILLWGSIREPFTMKIIGDKDYLLSYTKGFSELPSPAQLKASLAEQLSVDQLRIEFRRYIKTKVAQELVDFYLDSLDREEVMGFFERQAVTMRIVEQYIREGAPDQVNISEECREKVLATDVTAYDIFDDARAEVLAVMETNFQRDFVTTEGFRRIVNASEEEQRELRLLRAGGMLPGTPSAPLRAGANADADASSRTPAPPRSPLIPGLVAAFKKVPFIRDIAAASAARRASRSGRVGATRVWADPFGGSGGGGGSGGSGSVRRTKHGRLAVGRTDASGIHPSAPSGVRSASAVAATRRGVGRGYSSAVALAHARAAEDRMKSVKGSGGAGGAGVARPGAARAATATGPRGVIHTASDWPPAARGGPGGGGGGGGGGGAIKESSDSLSGNSLLGLSFAMTAAAAAAAAAAARNTSRSESEVTRSATASANAAAASPQGFGKRQRREDTNEARSVLVIASSRPAPTAAEMEDHALLAAPATHAGQQNRLEKVRTASGRGTVDSSTGTATAGHRTGRRAETDSYGAGFEAGLPEAPHLELVLPQMMSGGGPGGDGRRLRGGDVELDNQQLWNGLDPGWWDGAQGGRGPEGGGRGAAGPRPPHAGSSQAGSGAGSELFPLGLPAGIDRIEDGVEGLDGISISPKTDEDSSNWVRFSDWIMDAAESAELSEEARGSGGAFTSSGKIPGRHLGGAGGMGDSANAGSHSYSSGGGGSVRSSWSYDVDGSGYSEERGRTATSSYPSSPAGPPPLGLRVVRGL